MVPLSFDPSFLLSITTPCRSLQGFPYSPCEDLVGSSGGAGAFLTAFESTSPTRRPSLVVGRAGLVLISLRSKAPALARPSPQKGFRLVKSSPVSVPLSLSPLSPFFQNSVNIVRTSSATLRMLPCGTGMRSTNRRMSPS